ncbi:MAG: ISL3 family transposase [Cellulomonas sp.]
MSHATGCAGAPTTDPCSRCDLLLGLDDVHVEAVERGPTSLTVTVSTPWQLMGCPVCGVVAVGRGRRLRRLHDVPGAVPVTIRWRQRTWRCPDAGCGVGVFVEQLPTLVRSRGSLTDRAVTWAIGQLRREHATIQGLSRQLGTTWKTLWRAVAPRLADLAEDEARLAGVATLGVDEHVWHHTPHKAAVKGPTMLTGMVDLTRDRDGRVHARLLDLVPGRSGTVLAAWLKDRTECFRDQVQVATLDPFRGYANALRDELSEATPVLDAFHVVKLAGQAMDEVRRRVQQDTLGHRGHAGDPLYRIRNILRAGAHHLTERQWDRLTDCLGRGDPDDEVLIAWQCYQQVRSAYATGDLAAGKEIAEKIVTTFATCPIPEIARLGRTLRQWKTTYLSYFTTDRSSNGGTEAINGIIELHRRIARGYRNRHNYRLRMLLVAGGLDLTPPPEVR